jgi:enoyl-CoA hydratase/carnithine racemase
MVPGEEAAKIGLATRVSASPLDDALALAREIAARNPHAVRGAKQLISMAGVASLAEGFAEEIRIQRGIIGTPNQTEAVKAFFEKREPVFEE